MSALLHTEFFVDSARFYNSNRTAFVRFIVLPACDIQTQFDYEYKKIPDSNDNDHGPFDLCFDSDNESVHSSTSSCNYSGEEQHGTGDSYIDSELTSGDPYIEASSGDPYIEANFGHLSIDSDSGKNNAALDDGHTACTDYGDDTEDTIRRCLRDLNRNSLPALNVFVHNITTNTDSRKVFYTPRVIHTIHPSSFGTSRDVLMLYVTLVDKSHPEYHNELKSNLMQCRTINGKSWVVPLNWPAMFENNEVDDGDVK